MNDPSAVAFFSRMKAGGVMLGLIALTLVFAAHPSFAKQEREMTARDLLAEYERLVPVNDALHQGKWVTKAEKFPKALGQYLSRAVEEIFFCGDVCPQYGNVVIRFAGVAENECVVLGDPIYSYAWGKRYQGCSPLVVRQGVIQRDRSSWILVSTQDGRSHEKVGLRFNEQSECPKSKHPVSCDAVGDGRQVSVIGIRSGDDLAVLKLEM